MTRKNRNSRNWSLISLAYLVSVGISHGLYGETVRPGTERVQASPESRAMSGERPYPPSPVITGVTWAPPSEILRLAQGSDNWPLTWADDDRLYTAYGDGKGFAPSVPKKLSLGLARVSGSPPNIQGKNIRSTSGEQYGDGARGKKASGLLMLQGTLYMWARNAGNAQLARSEDHGKTWTWSDCR